MSDAQAVILGVLLGIALQVQDDARAALGARHRLHGEIAIGARLPAHAALRRRARLAGQDLDAIGHDECRVEADAELADELRVLLLIPGEGAKELRRAGFGDGAEVGDRLLARHADAVVADRERAGLRIGVDPDGKLGAGLQQRGIGDRRKAQPIIRIGGVGDELAQEDLPVAVQGVDHELHELAHFGLKAVRFFLAVAVMAADPMCRGSRARSLGVRPADFQEPSAVFKLRLRMQGSDER